MMLFMVKMSFSQWSKIEDRREYGTQVTFMDREVAGNWLDSMRPDTSFRFRNYEHNSPDPEHSNRNSTNLTDLGNSYKSTINSDEEYVVLTGDPHIDLN